MPVWFESRLRELAFACSPSKTRGHIHNSLAPQLIFFFFFLEGGMQVGPHADPVTENSYTRSDFYKQPWEVWVLSQFNLQFKPSFRNKITSTKMLLKNWV